VGTVWLSAVSPDPFTATSRKPDPRPAFTWCSPPLPHAPCLDFGLILGFLSFFKDSDSHRVRSPLPCEPVSHFAPRPSS
jgi:hypothetical protein